MSQHRCTVCHIPVRASEAFIRSVSLTRVYWCKPCAEDAGLVTFVPRQRVGVEVEQAAARGVAAAEAYANGGRMAG